MIIACLYIVPATVSAFSTNTLGSLSNIHHRRHHGVTGLSSTQRQGYPHPPPTLLKAATLPPDDGTPNKLDEFLLLMGRCYGVAGLAHAVDFATSNALPAAAGLPPFSDLDTAGQALGVVWCAVGIVQPALAGRNARQSGIVAYGVYEIVLTLAAALVNADGLASRLGAAVGVQVVVAYCYYELRRQSIEELAEEE